MAAGLTPEMLEKIKARHAELRIPAGKTCGDCCNYESYCADVLRSDRGRLDPTTRYCYFGNPKYYFNVDFMERR